MHIDTVECAEKTRLFLQKCLHASNLAHLWIWTSPSHERAYALAQAFALDWLGAPKEYHADMYELKLSGKLGLHAIGSIRALMEQVALASFGERGKVVLIAAADKMLPVAANSLLKVLEEPPPKTLIILVTDALHRIMPTIVSRAQVFRIPGQLQRSLYYDQVEPVLEAFSSYTQIFHMADSIQALLDTEQKHILKEKSSSSDEEELLEGDAVYWQHMQSKLLLEDIYVYFRAQGLGSPKMLQQVLDGIDRGATLKDMLIALIETCRLSRG